MPASESVNPNDPDRLMAKARPRRRVTVIGAGFSGLASAFYLSRAGFQVDVIEEQERVGGLISTTETSFGLVESAANGFLNSALVEELFGLMGLDVVPTMKTARRRFIFRRGLPRRWPLGLSATLRLMGFIFLFVFWRRKVVPRPQETVRVWTERTLGRETGQYLVEAFLQGIYAGDPARMSARLLFGRFFDKRRRSLVKPRVRGTVSAMNGMGHLVARMRERLERQGVTFVMNQKFPAFTSEPRWPHIVATSAHAAGELLRSLDPVRAEACRNVELVPIISVAVGFKEAPPEIRGFGCLFPPVEGRKALGVLMNSFIFPNRSTKGFSETWIFGGARANAQELMAIPDREVIEMAVCERLATLNATGEFSGYRVTRWPAALPHYTLALEETLPEMLGFRRNVVLVGNYLGEIGLARILERAAGLPSELLACGEWRS
jgi:oxygen-dependent protoporphyrinogen oxidase